MRENKIKTKETGGSRIVQLIVMGLKPIHLDIVKGP